MKRSPGDDTAWRDPARISWNGCSSAGRGWPNRRSHASEPIPITQVRPASRLRNSTARNNAGRSAQNDRTVERWSGPGFIVTTRKIADRVRGAATGCGLITPSMPVFAAVIRDNSCSGIRWWHVWIHTASLTKRWQTQQWPEFFAWLAPQQPMSERGQSRRMRPACFSSECPLLPGSDS